MQPKVNYVNLDADQQGHFIVLLTDQINEIKARILDDTRFDDDPCNADLDSLIFNATCLGHVIDNKVDEKSLDYLTALDEEVSEVQ